MTSEAGPLHRNFRRVALVVGIMLVLVLAFVAVRFAPLLLAPNDFAGTPSIERARTYHDPALLRTAWRQPVASQYRRMPYEFQRNQSVCGPTSVADILHSLGDARTQEQVLAGSPNRTWFGYLLGGLTLDQLSELLARAAGRPTRILRDQSLPQFRAEMSSINDPGRRIIVNFHRGPLFGRGHGHFSPLLAYLPDRDLVLVGDVNRQYRPFLVDTARLWRAVNIVDAATGKRRGLVVLEVGS